MYENCILSNDRKNQYVKFEKKKINAGSFSEEINHNDYQ